MTARKGDMELNALLDGELAGEDATPLLNRINGDPVLADRLESLAQVSRMIRNAYRLETLPAVPRQRDARKRQG